MEHDAFHVPYLLDTTPEAASRPRSRSSGRKLGRPKGSLGVSRLDGKEDEIRRFLGLGVSKTAITKCGRVPYHPLQLISTRGLRLSR